VRLAFDTNLIAYAEGVERVPADAAKRVLASHITDRTRGETLILARQTLAELHSVLIRKRRLSPTDASARTRLWMARAELIDTDAAVFDTALELACDHKLQIFDALILAAAGQGGCDLLLSEDMQDGFAWRGVVVTNPFGPSPDSRLARFLA
jgi:predicted nucleic acid-binding protein